MVEIGYRLLSPKVMQVWGKIPKAFSCEEQAAKIKDKGKERYVPQIYSKHMVKMVLPKCIFSCRVISDCCCDVQGSYWRATKDVGEHNPLHDCIKLSW